jgi:hypothetical protein
MTHSTTDIPISHKVNAIQPPGDKEGFTVTLTIQADGYKYPALIVFKGAQKTGKLSENIMKKLVLPDNVEVTSQRSAWWCKELDEEWIEGNFVVDGRQRVLIRDQFTVHKMDHM